MSSKQKPRQPREVDMAPVIPGESYTVGLYKWQRGKSKELSVRPVINGQPFVLRRGDEFPDEAYDVEPLMLVTIRSGVAVHEAQLMLRTLAEQVHRESRAKLND